ncbi:MAG: group III truncated hemoglobin [bacterium]|nr:group III truncated hemoglobin [bacterium]
MSVRIPKNPDSAGSDGRSPAFAQSLPIDRESIHRLVHIFYGRVRENFSLGPIFEGVIGRDPRDWDAHLAKLCDFWETVLLGVVKYKGQPISIHRKMQGLEPAHFTAWLNLFDRTAREIFAPEDAERILKMAARMAVAIQRR